MSQPKSQLDLDQLSINTIRTLAIDGVQKANSGHPGAPMGLAPVVYALWQRYLRYDPADPLWPNRDRFVLSNGHASMLLYATLHLTGVRDVDGDGNVRPDKPAISMDDLKSFRQLDSKTPGHPESHMTAGVETTTGPLGQGVGNSVGMAIASKWLGANYNKPGLEIFDFNVYAMCGDGDMMEGVGCEAASLAGHLKLSNLCWIYDHNHVTLDGPASYSFSEDVMTRFVGYGWNVTRVADANDLEMLAAAYNTFLKTKDRPTLIVVDSHIGYGSPHKQDSYEFAWRTARRRGSETDQEILWLARGCASFWCRTAFMTSSRKASASAARNSAVNGRRNSRSTRNSFRIWPNSSI